MKNKIISLKIFREGFRQTRTIGIVFTVIMSISAVLCLLSRLPGEISAGALNGTAEKLALEGMEVHFILFFLPVIMAPLLTLYLFQFLNKRSTSDFYHALPYKRTAIYLSLSLAIVAWLAVTTVISTAVSVITSLFLSKYITVVYSSLLMLALNCFAAALLVTASVLIAMSITGRPFANILVSLMIIFVPRILILFFSSTVSSSIPIFIEAENIGLLSYQLNVVTNIVLGSLGTVFIGISSFRESMYGLLPFIYTTLLAAVYFAVGCILFKNRKSETAEKSAPNRILQAVFRITLTMSFCLIICSLIFYNMVERSAESIILYITLYVIAILIYFVYELITTKKWKCVLHSAPGLIIVALLNVAIIFGLKTSYDKQLDFSPSAESIVSISPICNEDDSSILSLNESVDLRGSEIEIKDKQLSKIISESLKTCTDFIKEHPGNSSYYNMFQSSESSEKGYSEYSFKIVTDSGTYCRKIPIEQKNMAEVNKLLTGNEEYLKMWRTLPDAIDNTVGFESNINFLDGSNLTDSRKNDVFESFKKELKQVDIQKYIEMSRYNSIGTFEIYFSARISSTVYRISVPVFDELFPQTYMLYSKYCYDGSENKNADIRKMAANGFKGEHGNISITYYQYDSEKDDYMQYSFFSDAIENEPEKCTEAVYFALDHSKRQQTEKSQNFYTISISTYELYSGGKFGNTYNYDSEKTYTCVLKADDTPISEVTAILNSK